MKAIGTGLHFGVTWQDVEVVRHPGGRPGIRFTGKAADTRCYQLGALVGFAAQLGCKHAHISLTHTKEQALAFVVLEG